MKGNLSPRKKGKIHYKVDTIDLGPVIRAKVKAMQNATSSDMF